MVQSMWSLSVAKTHFSVMGNPAGPYRMSVMVSVALPELRISSVAVMDWPNHGNNYAGHIAQRAIAALQDAKEK